MSVLKQFVAAICAAACIAMASPAAAFVAPPAGLAGLVQSDVQLVARRSASTRSYARKSAARTSTRRAATRRSAYRAQTKRYQLRRDTHRLQAKSAAAKKERARTRSRVRRGVGY